MRLDAFSTSRAAPERICRLPAEVVSSLSPANIVAPTEAAVVPSRAPSADTIVPDPRLGLPKIGETIKLIDNMIDIVTGRVPRVRGILVSMRADVRIATAPQSVNL
jgi:hypothetical protein